MVKILKRPKTEIDERFHGLLLAISGVMRNDLEENIQSIAECIVDGLKHGGTVYAFGNGGSASEADHFVGELTGAYEDRERPAMKGVALSSQPASQTAIANDFGYAEYPARLLHSMTTHDTVILLSTSGTSANVLRVLEVAKEISDERAPYIVLICGQKGESPPTKFCDRIVVPSMVTSTIQEATLFVLHQLASHIERMSCGG